jgi:hypothetical protein
MKSRAFLICLLLPAVVAQLQVIGAGFSRTGTDTMRIALEILGYPCYHMKVIIEGGKLEDMALWAQYFKGEKAVLDVTDNVYDKHGYTAAVDYPTAGAWKELAAVYPNAKIVLTERSSPEVWWKSAAETVLIPNRVFSLLYKISPFFKKVRVMIDNIFMPIIGVDLDEPRMITLDDKDAFIDAYKRNSREAREFEDQERMLIFDVRQGWEPLCAFLGKDIPDVPFPHANSKADFDKLIVQLVLALVVPPSLLILGVVYLAKKFRNKGKAGTKKD